MNIYSMYSVKIKHYNHIFEKTAEKYQAAVDFYMDVCFKEWPRILEIPGTKERQMYVEQITHRTRNRPEVKYDFAESFYKFPSYLRRSAISEAIGKVASYKSNLKNWESNPRGKAPAISKAGRIYPAMFRDNMYVRIDSYTAKIKIYIRNTWDWLTVSLRKSDVDYILHHWKCREVQRIVTDRAHRLGNRISRVCAWETSALAYDGSGRVERDAENYSMCTFATGKRYHCDLSATYNIGARYYIREILKSLTETLRLVAEAKVPACTKRSTCTYSTLINLNVVLAA